MMRRSDCPNTNRCAAPLCPLDPCWREQTQMDYEPVCFLLQGLAINKHKTRNLGNIPEPIAERVVAVMNELCTTRGYSYIRDALLRSSSIHLRQ